ncbi:MAG: adenylate kinase [Planctomycetes bacterium]|jgi:adenylate kinase|nr:adenylate kinase [Planctomycetota bacterium]MBT4028279.1 adenylate kinase [Planctomycetota bacterium]MBT4560928.1 adenylate kinase [Planctomycetota bacterium]MBT5119615.1 adenylate kinase [Planctomycetota bacterium]MBT7012782.1 adenylate kinase [Planctomycetota bacterium]
MIAILLGPPGVGKGTQAKLAAAANGWKHLSTGELLRDEVARGTELGQAADGYMSRGDLVPDDLMLDMVVARVNAIDDKDVLLLDGFPRTFEQADALSAKAPSGSIRLALYFSAPDSVLTSRLLGRGRKDDTKEVITHRLGIYHKTTAPLVAFYLALGVLSEIDSDRSVEAIQVDTVNLVRTHLDGSDPS